VQRALRGTGLGLSLSRRFAEILGGTVSVESRLGAGSTFYARTPIHLPSETETHPIGGESERGAHAR